MRLERLDLEAVDWDRLDGFEDRLVYQTREWLEFVARTQDAEPVVAAVLDGSVTVGYFTGLVVRRFGIGILGSPMPGWTTADMGFNLEPGISSSAATEALLEFAFDRLDCGHLELRGPHLPASDVERLGFEATPWHGVEVDLRGTEDEVFGRMKAPCRTAIRKAAKLGVTVEEAADPEFADDFLPQLSEVFAKQSLVPPYGPERIQALIRDVHPSGRLLLLRARDSEGTCIATGIFPGTNRKMHFLAGASWREHQHLRPNEAVMWHAMRYWKQRGVETCDLGGYMSYKRKYGVTDVHRPFLRKSRSRRIAALRDLAQAAHGIGQRLRGRIRSPHGAQRSLLRG